MLLTFCQLEVLKPYPKQSNRLHKKVRDITEHGQMTRNMVHVQYMYMYVVREEVELCYIHVYLSRYSMVFDPYCDCVILVTITEGLRDGDSDSKKRIVSINCVCYPFHTCCYYSFYRHLFYQSILIIMVLYLQQHIS